MATATLSAASINDRFPVATDVAAYPRYSWAADLNFPVGAPDPTRGQGEQQLVTITATGGTFTLTYSGQTTSAIAYDAAAATVQTALIALSNLATGDVVVSGDAGGPYTCQFGGTLKGADLTEMTASGASLTRVGTATVATVTPGDTGVNEVQSVTLDSASGTFTITYDGQTTSALAENASAATVTTALDALSNLEPGDLIATGSAGGPYTLTFGGTLAETDVDEVTADATSLVRVGLAVPSTVIAGATVSAAAAATATVDAAGDLAFTGLTALTTYYACAEVVEDVYTIVAFTADDD